MTPNGVAAVATPGRSGALCVPAEPVTRKRPGSLFGVAMPGPSRPSPGRVCRLCGGLGVEIGAGGGVGAFGRCVSGAGVSVEPCREVLVPCGVVVHDTCLVFRADGGPRTRTARPRLGRSTAGRLDELPGGVSSDPSERSVWRRAQHETVFDKPGDRQPTGAKLIGDLDLPRHLRQRSTGPQAEPDQPPPYASNVAPAGGSRPANRLFG